MPWLDSLDYIERYAYFGAFEDSLMNEDGTGVSAIGATYMNYTSTTINPIFTS